MVESPRSSASLTPSESPETAIEPGWRAWGARGAFVTLSLLMLLSFTNQFHRSSLPALDTEIMRQHQMDPESMGLLKSVFYFVYTLLMVLGGWLADRVGTRATLLLVAAGSGVFGALCGLTGLLALAPAAAWWWLAGARGLLGATSAPLYPSTSRTVGSWFSPRRRELANGMVIGAAPVGIGAALVIMPSLSSHGLGWRGAFVAAGAATSVVAIVWAVLGRSRPATASPWEPPAPQPRPAGPWRRASGRWLRFFKNRSILALTLSYSTVGYFEYILFQWLSYYFKEVLKLPEKDIGFYNVMPYLSMMVFTPLGGWACGRIVLRLGERRGYRLFPAGCMALAAALLAAGALAGHLPTKVALLSLALGAIGATEGPFWTAAVKLGGPLGATTGGFVNTGGNLLGTLAPYFTPLIAGWVNRSAWGHGDADPLLGWTVALIAGSVVTIAGAAFWFGVDMDGGLEDIA
jgi:MFS transporter, ACS family, D-galactonate transporter